jgi:hypothetical protein
MTMLDLLQATVDEGCSDLHIRVGIPPMLRVHGSLTPLDTPPLTREDTYELVKSITSEEKLQEIERNGGADFALPFGDVARFRVSAFKERGNYSLAPDPEQAPVLGTDWFTRASAGVALQTAWTYFGDRTDRVRKDHDARQYVEHHQQRARCAYYHG